MPAFALLRTAVAAIATVAATSARAEDCSLKQLASLRLTESGDHVLVSVTIAGKSLQFEFALEDAYSAIDKKTANKLSLAETPMPSLVTPKVHDQPITARVAIPAFQVDNLLARDIKLFEVPVLREADGILGLDIIGSEDLELDVAHGKANLFSRNHCTGRVIYWSPPGDAVAVVPVTLQKTHNILVDMSLDGKDVTVGVMTAGISSMGMNVAHRLFGIDANTPGLRKIGSDANGQPIYRYPFRSIEVQGLKILNPEIEIQGAVSDPECDAHEHADPTWGGRYRCYGGADLFLGLSVLKSLHLFFAFGEKMLYATAAS